MQDNKKKMRDVYFLIRADWQANSPIFYKIVFCKSSLFC